MDRSTLILTRSDVRGLLDYAACIDAVEEGFRAEAKRRTIAAAVLATHVTDGGFHVKTAGLERGRFFYASKINANFPRNPSQTGLPTIQGVLALFDAINGRLLALMDSMEITMIRTAAATAVAAKYLARPDSRTIAILGCGIQGRSQLRALSGIISFEQVFAYDADITGARSYAAEMSDVLKCSVIPVADYHAVVHDSDVIVTSTPSQTPLLRRVDIRKGTFIAAVGADSETKHEIAPDLMAAGKVVVDVLDQCATIGDLHHAIDAGAMQREDVYAELAEIVGGRRPGRASADEITIFDSTGTALEDVAAGSVVYERAVAQGVGTKVSLGS